MRFAAALVSLLLGLVVVTVAAPVAWANGTFDDDDGNAHEGYIEAVADEGIAQGCEPEQYCPSEPVTRDQMATFLARALDLGAAEDDHFDDDDGNPHEGAINALAEMGIVRGCGERAFCPHQPVTRAQMATFIVEGFDLIGSEVNFFRDDNGHLHEGSIDAAARGAITQGCDESHLDYCPEEAVRRDQMATFLAKALGLTSHAEPARTFHYQVGSRGDVQSDIEGFRQMVADTLRDSKGWTLDGAVSYLAVSENGDVRIWLASPEEVDNAAPGCSDEYSCRVGDDLYINDERWQDASATYRDRSLTAYRHYVINHEFGHWLELDHRECPYEGGSAWVMQQQTIALDGCESRVWPHPEEKDQARANLGPN